MKYENKVLMLEQSEATKIISNMHLENINDNSVAESVVDTFTVNLLVNKLAYIDNVEVKQKRTNIEEVDKSIPSKTVKGTGTGELDVSIFEGRKLRVVIENKEPKSDKLQEAIDDAIYYCNGLRKNNIDIRIAIGFNGINCIVRVFDETFAEKWVPFYINGDELKAFPGKELVNLIYQYQNLNSIVVEDSHEHINIQQIIRSLKNKYRSLPYIQNDNQRTIDFTIAFIALKSILEKHGRDLDTNWDLLAANPNNSEDYLRYNIINTIDKIIRNRKTKGKFDEIFIIKDGDNETFNFSTVLDQFESTTDLLRLKEIYEEISKLHDLHSSKIDLFGEVYESLGNKDTKKAFGQFFTRRHIIKTLVRLLFEDEEIVNIIGTTEVKSGKTISTNPRTICDPACGTGGFLTETFKYLETVITGMHNNFNLSDLAQKSFFGYDIYSSNAVRTKINMYLAGDGFSEIEQKDSLRELDQQFNYIITNPPYGNGSAIVDESVINNTRLEVNFLIQIVKLLKPSGKALVIIPDGILESTTLCGLREWFLKQCQLEKVISLPKHTFAPYTHEKTFAIYFKKRVQPLEDINECAHESIWGYIVDNDGYANSDKKFRTDRVNEYGMWLHDEMSDWRRNDGKVMKPLLLDRWRKKTHGREEKFFDEWQQEIKGQKYGFIKVEDILEDEMVSYKAVKSQDILKIIKDFVLDQLPDAKDKLFDNEALIKEYEDIYKELGIIYDSETGEFYNTKSPIYTYLKYDELLTLINKEIESDSSNTMSKLKKIGEIYDNDGNIKVDIQNLFNKLGVIFSLGGKSMKFWIDGSISFELVSEEKLLSIIISDARKYMPSKIDDVFELDEDGNRSVKPEYQGMLDTKDVYYDEYDNKFYDRSQEIIKKVLMLIPERYFRNESKPSIDIESFIKESEDVLSDIKSKLLGLVTEIGGELDGQ